MLDVDVDVDVDVAEEEVVLDVVAVEVRILDIEELATYRKS